MNSHVFWPGEKVGYTFWCGDEEDQQNVRRVFGKVVEQIRKAKDQFKFKGFYWVYFDGDEKNTRLHWKDLEIYIEQLSLVQKVTCIAMAYWF